MWKKRAKQSGLFVIAVISVLAFVFRPVSAAVSFLAVSNANNASGGTTLSLTAPTGTASTDVMIAVVSVRGGTGTSITAPSGWQLVDSRDSTTVLKSSVYYGVRAQVGEGPYDFTFASQKASGVVTSYSGVDTVSPVDTSSGQANASNAASAAPSISTTHANTMIVGAHSTATGTTYSSSDMTHHTGGIGASTGGMAGTRTTSAMHDATQSGIGASGSKTLTFGAAAVNIGHTIALKPAPSVSQVSYRFFANANSTTPGATLAAKDTALAIETGTPFRLRLNLGVSSSDGSLSVGREFKLQYALSNGSCDTGFSGESYADITGITPVRYYDNATPTDGDAYATTGNDPTRVGITSVAQTYQEVIPFVVTTSTPSNQDALWDFSLTTSGTTPGQQYCIRAINSIDGSYNVLEGGYSVIPTVNIPVPTYTQANYRWFANADSAAPGAALAAQDTSTSVSVNAPFRLRQRVAVDSASLGSSGQNFKMQYAERTGACDTSFSGETYNDIVNAGDLLVDTDSVFKSATTTGSADNAQWVGPSNAVQDDGGPAYMTFTGIGEGEHLLVFGDPPTIPSNATITGFSAHIDVGYLGDIQLDGRLIIDQTPTGSSRSFNLPAFPDLVDTGGTTDMWGTSLTTANINAATSIGVELTPYVYDVLSDLEIDNSYVTIYYSLPTAVGYYNNTTPSSGATISSTGSDPTNGARGTSYQTYLETDPFTNSVASVSSGSDGMWDFSLSTQPEAAGKTYCFRVVKSSGSLLDTYSAIPEVTITSSSSGPTLQQSTRGGGGVVDGVKYPFSW